MKKLQSKKAETLVETLAAIVVVLLVMLFLSVAVSTASKVNAKVRHTDVSLTYSDASKCDTKTVTVQRSNNVGQSFTVTVDEYKDANGYTFYKESADQEEGN